MDFLTKLPQQFQRLFRERKAPIFNTLIEGRSERHENHLYFKLINIDIPDNTGILEGSIFPYTLIGKTDFQTYGIKKIEKTDEPQEIFSGVADQMGPIIDYYKGNITEGNLKDFLDRRFVFLKDGRIFMNQIHIKEQVLFDMIEGWHGLLKEVFNNPQSREIYSHYIKHQNLLNTLWRH